MGELSSIEIAKAGWSRIQVLRMMTKGVAFCDTRRKGMHWVFSHEGDYLGDIPSFEVYAVIAYVKRMRKAQGRKFEIGKASRNDPHPGFTFAWQGYPDFSKWVPISERFKGDGSQKARPHNEYCDTRN